MPKTTFMLAAVLVCFGAPGDHANAQDATKKAQPELTEAEKQERDMRKTCKVDLCSVFHNKKPTTGNVTCNVIKTWRKEQLTEMVSKGGISWPWGAARCTADLKFDRATLIKAMSEAEFEAAFEKHDVKCELDRDAAKYEVKIEMTPKVVFKAGKAVKASINWGKIDAPLLAKSALWSATAADNTFGVLQNTVVEDINYFIGNSCMEVKEEWQGK